MFSKLLFAASIAAAAAAVDASTLQRPNTTGANRITLTGCVQEVTPIPVGTSGPPTSNIDVHFQLTNAEPGPDGTSPAGIVSSASTTTMADTFRLDVADAQMTPHVGHKVQITGTVEEHNGEPVPNAAGTRGGGAISTAPKVKVEAVKMISATCP